MWMWNNFYFHKSVLYKSYWMSKFVKYKTDIGTGSNQNNYLI